MIVLQNLFFLGKASVFSKLDFRDGFYQIEVTEKDRFKTAFQTPLGLYEWNVMPMGACNSPAYFQLMYDLFKDYHLLSLSLWTT